MEKEKDISKIKNKEYAIKKKKDKITLRGFF